MNYDLPIEDIDEDEFMRGEFVNHLVNIISKSESSESFVIGIEGEWGIGKTSTLNCVKKELKKKNFEVLDFDILHCKSIKIDLTRHLYEEILGFLYSIKRFRNDDEIIDSIISILKVLSISEKVLFNSERLSVLSKATEKYFEKQNQISNLKNKISDLLVKIKRPIIICLDDLDRLNKEEVIEIIQLIKFNANFQNIIYVLSYDKNILSKLLEDEQEIDGNEYLKKIVQFERTVPQINKMKLFNFLDKQLEKKLKGVFDFDDKYFNCEDYHNLKISILEEKVKTPRDIKRIVNLFYQDFILLNNNFVEINPLDLLILSIIRESYPYLFGLIISRNNLFVENFPKSSDLTVRNIVFDQLADNKDNVICSRLICLLFPNLNHIFSENTQFGNLTYGRDHLSEWKSNLRICTRTYFQKYADKTTSIDWIITEKRFYSILERSKEDISKFNESLSELVDKNLIEDFLSKLDELFRSDKISNSSFNLENLLLGIAQLGDKLSLNSNSLISFSPSMLGIRVFYSSSRSLDSENYFNILKNIIGKVDDISLISQVISIESKRDEKNIKQKDKRFNLKQEKELQKLILDRLNFDSIFKNKDSIYLLFLIKEWDNKLFEEIKKEIVGKIEDSNFCLDFVSRFITISKSQTVGSNYVHTKKRISKESLFEIINQKLLIKKLEEMNNPRSKELLDLINQKED